MLDEKHSRNGVACSAIPIFFLVEPDNLISKYFFLSSIIYVYCIIRSFQEAFKLLGASTRRTKMALNRSPDCKSSKSKPIAAELFSTLRPPFRQT